MRHKHRIHLFASRLHKWLALFIGAQLLIWFASGALMSFLPIDKVRGEHLVDRGSVVAIPPGTRFADPALISARVGGPVEAINLHMLDGRAVAEVTTGKGIKLVDAATGADLPPVSAAQATAIANAAWKSQTKPASTVSRVTTESPEYRGALPAWRISFSDPDSTSVFVAADTGRITAVRTGTWRLYDFFWSLHIMDWKNHEDFNTPWLLVFAIGGLLFGLAGTVLLVMRWPIHAGSAARHEIAGGLFPGACADPQGRAHLCDALSGGSRGSDAGLRRSSSSSRRAARPEKPRCSAGLRYLRFPARGRDSVQPAQGRN